MSPSLGGCCAVQVAWWMVYAWLQLALSSPPSLLRVWSSVRIMHRQTLAVNGHVGSPDTPASYYYGEDDFRPLAPEDVEQKLKRIGSFGEAAERVANIVSKEATQRRQMIGGVDNFWLLLSDLTNFNPVRPQVSLAVLVA